MLVCAQVVAIMASAPSGESEDARLAALARRISKNAADIEKLRIQGRDQAQKVAELENRMSRMPRRDVALITPGAAMAKQLPQSQAAPPAITPNAAPASPVLCLEPVVRLSESRTAYYKASLQRPGHLAVVGDGDPGHTGHADHDIELFRQVLPVMAKLRARRGVAGIFVPVSTATLEDSARLEAYVAALRASPVESAGVVLDIHVSALSTLGEPALRGLAWLASRAPPSASTGPGAAAIDLPALSATRLHLCGCAVPRDGCGKWPVEPRHGPRYARSCRFQAYPDHIRNDVRRRGSGAFPFRGPGRGQAFAAPRAVRPQPSHDYQSQQVA